MASYMAALIAASLFLTGSALKTGANVTSSLSVEGTGLKTTSNVTSNATATVAKKGDAKTFLDWYYAHTEGRGLWKWRNAIEAYQRHFGSWGGSDVIFAEVGVQSGGSIEMWHAVLGPKMKMYGLDINPRTASFAVQGKTDITIGDQGDPNMWVNFFSTKTPKLDILIDDGGHEPNQMLVTLHQAFQKTNPGGFTCIEDIHGNRYIEEFFVPAATYLASEANLGNVESVHVYPYLLIAHRAGKDSKLPKSELTFAGPSATVSDFNQLWAQIPNVKGGHIILENEGWGPFLTAAGMANFFRHFAGLHEYNMYDVPAGCATTTAAVCTNYISPSPQQAVVTGIHVYPKRLVVEVATQPPVIQAKRMGTIWIDYAGL